ncbi:hypothetical protein F1188_13515 [Roseospira marina]|uniref:Uncharacterized protein n=1 Tax=Roseospira marina TaxID=140057 RepID=A0A5M6IAS8_9PROT|nr:hypothetical protein [Roseospira marina]KAA5605047.1 hypothetical protein F1188_13515 [Roseospira marina]MBB4314942.1 putative transcriptional regulator [Roseospira marina]MBB5087942.1 putative transcriptional regulator [Roseospira marina]
MRNDDGFGTYLDTTRDLNAHRSQMGDAVSPGRRKKGAPGSVSAFLQSIGPTGADPAPALGAVPTGAVPTTRGPTTRGLTTPSPFATPQRATNPDSVTAVLRAIDAGHQDPAALVAAAGLSPGALLAVLQGQVFRGTVFDTTDDDGTRRFRLTEAGRRVTAAP